MEEHLNRAEGEKGPGWKKGFPTTIYNLPLDLLDLLYGISCWF